MKVGGDEITMVPNRLSASEENCGFMTHCWRKFIIVALVIERNWKLYLRQRVLGVGKLIFSYKCKQSGCSGVGKNTDVKYKHLLWRSDTPVKLGHSVTSCGIGCFHGQNKTHPATCSFRKYGASVTEHISRFAASVLPPPSCGGNTRWSSFHWFDTECYIMSHIKTNYLKSYIFTVYGLSTIAKNIIFSPQHICSNALTLHIYSSCRITLKKLYIHSVSKTYVKASLTK